MDKLIYYWVSVGDLYFVGFKRHDIVMITTKAPGFMSRVACLDYEQARKVAHEIGGKIHRVERPRPASKKQQKGIV